MTGIRVDGAELECECHGDARRPPLLLLHALGSSLAMWDAQLPLLAGHFRVVRYSMRGHGSSTIEGAQEPDIDALTADACAVLDALGVERAHWCGLSLGGMLAMRAAQRHPARVDRLVLANTAARLAPPEAWSQRMALARSQGMAALAEATMARWFTPAFHRRAPEEVARICRIFLATDPAAYAGACAAIRDMDQRAALDTISAPTLVIAGAADAGTTPAHAAELVAAIPGAQLATLDAAHLSNIEARDAFNAALLKHLPHR